MPLDVVCFYADLGNDYLPLIRRMTTSAKAILPDARTILLTPTPIRELCDLFDGAVLTPHPVTVENLCYERARATVSWQMATQHRSVLVDPDIVFLRPPEFGEEFDIALSWRAGKQDQPVNSGLVLSAPRQTAFWKKYGDVVANTPVSLHGWWCDQISYSLMIGVCHDAGDILTIRNTRIKLVDQRVMCAKPEDRAEDAWALHYKGNRKWVVKEMTRAKSSGLSGAGMSSPDYVSCTGIARAQS